MKTNILAVLALSSVLVTATGLAQGKGGGGGHGAGQGGGPGNGAGGSSRAFDGPSERAEKPGRSDHADAPKPARSAKPAAQELSGAMHDINQTAFAQRRELHENLDMRLKSSRDAVRQVQANAKDLRGAARDEFKAALDTVKARERELDAALKASRKSTEATWERDRSALDRAYRDFNDAVGRLDALPRPPKP